MLEDIVWNGIVCRKWRSNNPDIWQGSSATELFLNNGFIKACKPFAEVRIFELLCIEILS